MKPEILDSIDVRSVYASIYISMPNEEVPLQPYWQIVSNCLGQFFRIQQRITEDNGEALAGVPALDEIQEIERHFMRWATDTNANMPGHIEVSLEARMVDPVFRAQLREELQRLLRNLEGVYYFIGIVREEAVQEAQGGEWYPTPTVGVRPYLDMCQVILARAEAIARHAQPLTQSQSVEVFAMASNQ